MDKTPIYQYPASYARENGELEQYRASLKAHTACKCAIDDAIRDGWDNMNFVPGTARKVLAQFSPERVFFVLAYTVQEREYDTRITGHNQSWAKTVPLYGMKSGRGDCTLESHSTKVDLFIDAVQHEYLLSLPLKREDIKAEAQRILTEFQAAREPNSPNGTHYMAQISQDFLVRASTKDHDRLMAMLPFQSLVFSSMVGRNGLFALISKDENRSKPLRLRKPSVRKKLQEQPDAPKPPSKGKATEQEL
ncbi:MAG: DUF3849 domain-containing protein [Oscillospiraceae bacterium]|nr:DUF3849 domain-containing protein [Oscillospiraceae bacterium]